MAKIDLNDYLEKLTEPEDRETVANRAYQRELFEQYVTKDGNFPEQRAQLLEDFRVGKELTGPKGLRRKLGAFDLEYFGRAYLAHYFVRPSPKFHGELDRIWREGVLKGMNPEVDAKRISRADGCRRAIEAPRGHAKSTTFTFKDDLHAAVYGYKHYIIILSDSSEQAEGFLVDIKTELEENAALKEDFGELEGKVWKSSVILLANGVKIEAIGSGKKIRGRRHKQWRPDLEMLLMEETIINDTFLDTTPQELISYFLAQAGLSKMKLSSKTYPTRKMLPIRRQTAVQAINAVNAAWGLRVPFFFSGGVFYWDEKPEQKKVYTFERGVNILNLRRAGGVWELETVSAPFIKHSHKINLIHPQVSGEVEVSKVVSKTNDSGFIRTYIYF